MSKLTKDERKYLLNLFRSHDELRPNLHHVMEVEWLNKDWICTSNGYSAILIKDQKDINVDREVKTVNVRAVLPESVSEQLLDLVHLKNLFEKVPMITRKIRTECETCEGEGKFEHFGESYWCKSCDEKGYLEESKTETIKDPEYHLSIDGKFLIMPRWEELMNLISVIKCENATLFINQEKPGLVLIQLNEDIVVLLAKTHVEDESKVKTVRYDGKEVESE